MKRRRSAVDVAGGGWNPMGRQRTIFDIDVFARLFWRLSAGSRAGSPRGLLRVWPWWERVARRIWLTRSVPGTPNGIFALHLTQYRGQTFALPDGAMIEHGDRVAELHANGAALLRFVGVSKWHVVTAASDDLRSMAAWILESPNMSDVKAFYAVTLLLPGTKRLGFTTRTRKVTWRTRLQRFFLSGLLALYSGEGTGRLSRGTTGRGFPQEAWMSRQELFRRYG